MTFSPTASYMLPSLADSLSCMYVFNRKSDLKRSEATLRRLLQLSPGHMTGTLQLARLLTDVYLVRSKQKAETTATQYEAITLEVCFLYERYMELIGDVSNTPNDSAVLLSSLHLRISSLIFLIAAKCGGSGIR